MKEKNTERIRKLFFLVAIFVFCISASLLFRKRKDDQKAIEVYNQVQMQAVHFAPGFDGGVQTVGPENELSAESGTSKIIPWYELAQVNFDYLQSENSDICGYLIFENEDIRYPILHGETNDAYLRTTYLGEHSTSGSIFMDCSNAPDFSDKHIIIYGHNMKNRTMFGKLKYYMTEEGYHENHMYFQIHMPDRMERYRIFEYKVVNADDAIYRLEKAQSDIEQDGPTRITLSTCSGDTKRMIVRAEKVDEKVREE